jgi:hypothetical protein
MQLDENKLKKLRVGEVCGNVATCVCAAILVAFVACFAVARVNEYEVFELVTIIVGVILMCAGIAVSAYCNIVCSGGIDKLVAEYVKDNCINQAALFHPDRDSLTFVISFDGLFAYVQVNGYKEKISFDFSPFKKISMSRKLQIVNEIENRLTDTFCRLYERGIKYSNVSFCEADGTRRKKSKDVFIIKEGSLDVKVYKGYLKRNPSSRK